LKTVLLLFVDYGSDVRSMRPKLWAERLDELGSIEAFQTTIVQDLVSLPLTKKKLLKREAPLCLHTLYISLPERFDTTIFAPANIFARSIHITMVGLI